MENKSNNKSGYLIIKQGSGLVAQVTDYEEGTVFLSVYIAGNTWIKDDVTTAEQIATEFKILYPVFKDAVKYKARIKHKNVFQVVDSIQSDKSDCTTNSKDEIEVQKSADESAAEDGVQITGYFENDPDTLDKFNQFSDQQKLSMYMKMINNQQVSEFDDLLTRWWANRY